METNPTRWQWLAALVRQTPASSLNGRLTGRLLSILVAAAALFSPSTGFAQESAAGTITGQDSNSGTRQYQENAEVTIVGTDQVAITGPGGHYVFVGVPAGEVKVAVSYTGLDRMEQTVTVGGGQVAKADFALTTAQYEQTVKLDTFVVTSAREGNAKAITDQKFALNVKTVISSDAFGDIPEGNLGEFLKLLPGITVDFVEADVRNVRVRGLPPKYNTITFDGHPVANSGSSDLTRLRALELEQVSLATVEATEVNKSPTADMASPGLAGNVNAVGKSAFSQQGRSIKYSVSGVLNEYHMTLGKERGWDDKTRRHVFPNASLEYIDTLMDGRLGVVAAISHSASFMQQKILNNGLGWDNNVEDSVELPTYTSIQYRDGPKPTWRDSAVINLDFKATDELTLKLRTSYGNYDAQFFNKDFTFGTSAAIVNATATPGNRTDRSQISQVTTTGNSTSRVQISSSNSRKMGNTIIMSPSVEWKKGDLTLEGSASYSKSINDYDTTEEGYFRTVTAQMNGVSWRYDLPDVANFQIKQLATVTGDTRSVFDLGNYNGAALSLVGLDPRKTKGQVWNGRIDATYDLGRLKMPTTLKFGVAHRQDVYDVIQSFGTNFSVATTALNAALPSSATNINLREFEEDYPAFVSKGATTTDVLGVTRSTHPTIDNFKLFQFFKTYVTDYSGTTAPTSGPFTANVAANLRGKLQSEADIDERQKSAYMMGTVKLTKKLTALAGLRYEKTETAGTSFDDIGHAKATAAAGTSNTNDISYIYSRYGSRIKRTKEYDNVLPSMQFRYEPKRNVVARFAYFKSILRPDYNQVTGGVTVNDASSAPFVFTLRNTEIVPEMSDNFDLALEYYFEPVGVVSVNLFYKKISDIQIANTITINSESDIPEAITDLGYTFAQLGTGVSTVATRLNGGEANVKGAEFSYSQELTYLPGALNGLGVTANLTYVQPSDEALFSSTIGNDGGFSRWSGNFIVRYKYKNFDMQVTSTYTNATVRSVANVSYASDGTRIEAPAGGRKLYTAARTVYGLNMGYRIHKNATVFLNVSNLTNEPQTRYEVRPLVTQRDGDYGATYNIGIKGRF
jgi:iron complex outermembrane recepter protein